MKGSDSLLKFGALIFTFFFFSQRERITCTDLTIVFEGSERLPPGWWSISAGERVVAGESGPRGPESCSSRSGHREVHRAGVPDSRELPRPSRVKPPRLAHPPVTALSESVLYAPNPVLSQCVLSFLRDISVSASLLSHLFTVQFPYSGFIQSPCFC